MAQIPSPTLPNPVGKTATAYLAEKSIYDCHLKFKSETDNLAAYVPQARLVGISSVFDQDAAHANGVAASMGPAIFSQVVTEDVVAREQIKLRSGVDPGSPVPPGMTLVPSN